MKIAVYGLWHLGCVTAACLAEAGHDVVGLDADENTIVKLNEGRPPLFEPRLEELVTMGTQSGRLRFTTNSRTALKGAEILWVAFDTPVNERDEADVAFVRQRLEHIANAIPPGTLILISSQVPVGFTRKLQRDWQKRRLRFAYSPENLRLGKALDCFRRPERVIVGLGDATDQKIVTGLFAPFCGRTEWMSLESAEMTKHALNAFLATSVTFINEVARLCELVGADAKEVERGLKSENRIGPRAYLSPGAAFAGGTLARDLRFLAGFAKDRHIETPLLDGVLSSNEVQKRWVREKLSRVLEQSPQATVAVLGLTYKPGTDTLRRSAAVELCAWLHGRGVRVQAHDPAVRELPEDLQPMIRLYGSAQEALRGTAAAVVATEWPDFRNLTANDFLAAMTTPFVVDPNWFLAERLKNDRRIRYVATGRPLAQRAA